MRLFYVTLLFFTASVSLAEDYNYPGLSPDYLTAEGNQLGAISEGDYGCKAIVAKTPKQEAGAIGATISNHCGGEVSRAWIPYSRTSPYGYWLICCRQAVRPHRHPRAR